ncbi:hypothetical protein LTR49_022272, partial [Elasticomyces elasticus]
MDSPYLQSASQPQRVRTNSNLSVRSIDQRAGIRKQSFDRSRSVSTSQVDRLQQLALDCEQPDFQPTPNTAGYQYQWITPRHSPQPENIFSEQSENLFSEQPVESYPAWSVPTPPRSDSGLPTVCLDGTEEPVTTGISLSQSFAFDAPTTSAEMSSLGLLLPSQYGGNGLFESEPSSYAMEQNYIPPMKVTQPSVSLSQSAYAHTTSSSPSLYQSRSVPETSRNIDRRQSELPGPISDQAYMQSFRRISSPYETASSNQYSGATNQTIPSISGLTQSPMPSQHTASYPGADATSHQSSMTRLVYAYSDRFKRRLTTCRSPAMYDTNVYQQSYSASPAPAQMYTPAQSLSYPPAFVGNSVNDLLSKTPSEPSIRVLNQRPKPQCWEHGCNGRQFSTFSNLLRHQREKSGTAPKSYCPKCGAEFTRTTARNGHLAHDK